LSARIENATVLRDSPPHGRSRTMPTSKANASRKKAAQKSPPRKKTARTAKSVAPTFGANLKVARLTANMTQAQVAVGAGISQNRIPVIEAGADLKLSTAQKLARAVGKSLRDLVPD
jgi:DNA-binding XRE family transcriptional regulator